MIEHKGYTIAPTGNPTPMRWMDYAASVEDGEPCEYFGSSVDDVKRQIDEGVAVLCGTCWIKTGDPVCKCKSIGVEG